MWAQKYPPILVMTVRIADEGIKYKVTNHQNGGIPARPSLGKEFFNHPNDVLKGMVGLSADFLFVVIVKKSAKQFVSVYQDFFLRIKK